MPLTGVLGKTLNLCWFIKRPSSPPPTPSSDLHRPLIPSTHSWLPFYLKKFTSLPISTLDSSFASSAATSDYEADVEVEAETSTPDFSSVYNSPRFFFSSPGFSNSILDNSEEEDKETVVWETLLAVVRRSPSRELSSGAVEETVETDSPDPYSDFRRSMEEMVEARELHDVPKNWGSLQQLLLRYLSLNPEPNHKFIAGAFADLLVSLMSSPPTSDDDDAH